MQDARHAQIDTPQAVADAFVNLARSAYETTLRFEDAVVHFPVALLSVDRVLGRCLLDIAAIGDLDGALDVDRPFVLHARQASETVQTSVMRPVEVLRRATRLRLRCGLPEQVTLSRRRGYFRAVLRADMGVAVVLCDERGRQWQARLRDLSIGGCLLSLPPGEAAGLAFGPACYQMRAIFPSGETFTAAGHLSHRYADAEAGPVHIGVSFDTGIQEQARDAWFYVREVEREVARQATSRPEMRPLAASRLFASDSASGRDGDE